MYFAILGGSTIDINYLAQRIWKVPAYLPYLQPPLTSEAGAEAEHFLGFALPSSYLELLRYQNGGYVRFHLPEPEFQEGWLSCIAGIGPHFPGIAQSNDWWLHDFEDDRVWFPQNPMALVPFEGDGHWHFAFDYRNLSPDGEPAVTFFDLTYQYERILTPDFATFLSFLEEEKPHGIGIGGQDEAKELIRKIEQLLELAPVTTNSYAHGYPIYRYRLGGEKSDEEIRITPNEVPRGFVQEEDDRYAELVNTMPGTALRYPAYPAIKLFIAISPGVAERIGTVLAHSSLTVFPLEHR